ncbi:MAG: endonuclease/exonuclease/phosphatase family protein [Paraglaciecola sp.]|uniref:endonuclease/exonuclease/phosphatase family protein n=1 Tax=Paraglaciecola sp. TaxID=1920173 RepID=UPI00329A7266
MLGMVMCVVTVVLFLLTILPLFSFNHWIFRVWEFPRVQLTLLAVLSATSCLFLNNPSFQFPLIGINLAVACYQLAWIIPYTRLSTKQVQQVAQHLDVQKLKILTSNVLMTNHSAPKLLDLISKKQPDVIVTLESDQWWQDALSTIHEDYPYRVNKPLDNLYGMHLFSRFPLEDIEVLELVEEGVPSIQCDLVLPDKHRVKCYFLHPAPPSPTENETAKPRDKELLMIAKEVADRDDPLLVTGDLNDVAWSPTTRAFRQISGLKDPRIGRGMFNTFHVDYPFLRWPLDHIFHSDHFGLVDIQRLPSIDSDHFPLFVELAFKGSN